MKPSGELLVITTAYDLALELTERVRKFPRDLRFVLGDRILVTVYDLLDTLVAARYSRDRAALLRQANLQLERLRFHVRMAHDLRVLDVRRYELVSEMVREAGRMVGGWTKAGEAG